MYLALLFPLSSLFLFGAIRSPSKKNLSLVPRGGRGREVAVERRKWGGGEGLTQYRYMPGKKEVKEGDSWSKRHGM